MGRPFVGPAGAYLRKLLNQLAPDEPVVFHNALGCKPPNGFDDFETATAACRPYLAQVLSEANPSRILVMGKEAGRGLLGRTFQPLSVRKGYGWVKVGDREVPAFLLPNPAAATRNKLVAKAFEEDLAWALSANPSSADLWDDYMVVTTLRDSLLAEQTLLDLAYPWSMDVEASGMQFEADYRLDCLSISAGEGATFVWSREALENPAVAEHVARMLEAHEYTSWNGQYDAVAVHCEALFTRVLGRPCRLNLVSDARLKRKLLDAESVANLATAAELVGLGGHKEEAHTLVDAIAKELSAWANSFLLTPTGRARKPAVLTHVDPALIPGPWKEYLQQGHRPEMFAYRFLPTEILHRYNALDALATWRLERWCEAWINAEPDQGLRRIWEDVTAPAMEAYIAMRIHGVPCDKEALKLFLDWLVRELAAIQKQLDGWALGFNALSNPQVVAMMEKLGVKSSRQTPGGKPSASKEVLEEFKDHEWLGKVLRFRKLDKLRGTYAVGMLGHVRSDGRVHSSFLQDGTGTGRSSSADPNLYNMPKPKTDEGMMLRLCFRAPPGRVLIECDESQIEIRVAADLSLDDTMVDLIKSGKDFHQGAADLMGRDRDSAKTTVFAILYEMPERLGGLVAKRLKITKKEGNAIAEAMFGQFKQLRPWMDEKFKDASACGYARTRWCGGPGRKRPLWALGDHSPQGEVARENAIRSTWNSEVQGTAVDIVNSKLRPVHRWLQANTRDGKILLQVYDSIMVEVDAEEADKTVRAMQEIMRTHPMAKVPLAVDAKVGETWGSMKGYTAKED